MTQSPQSRSRSRSAARLAAVQALYQHDMEAISIPRLLSEFHAHRIGAEIEDAQYEEAEIAFFDDIVTGVDARRAEIDALLTARLSSAWSIPRLDKTLLQILRAGTYELLARPDVPAKAVINEYLDIAHAFFDATEVKFANGVLDALSKEVRR